MESRNAVLLVEDNVDHAEHLSEILEVDFEVDVAADRSSCLRLLSERQYAFLIIDYCLDSGDNGLDILRELNSGGIDIPRIVVTAYGNEEVAVEALKLGAQDYVPKTLTDDYMGKVLRAVQEHLRRRYAVSDSLAQARVLNALRENRARLFENWRQRVRTLASRYGLPDVVPTEAQTESIYAAVLSDLERGDDAQTSALLDETPLDLSPDATGSYVSTTLLLIAFKDAARAVVREAFPESFDTRAELMGKLGQLIEGIELRTAKWFGAMYSQKRELEARAVELRLKSRLVTTLQHEVRQPLSYILNCAEDLAVSMPEGEVRSAIEKIQRQAEHIGLVLNRIEETTELITREYADGVEMLDLPRE